MRNVVLLCLDTVRADYFRTYAPRLRAQADLTYDQCRAASSWSVPSHGSMFTGELPSRSGVHDLQRRFDVLAPSDTFLGDLPDHESIGVSANVYASGAFGFDALFDSFVSVSPDRRFPEGIHVGEFGYECDAEGLARWVAFAKAALGHDHPVKSLLNGGAVGLERISATLPVPTPFDDGAGIIADQSLEAIGAADGPFVLFANFMEAHAPHRMTRGYDADVYDCAPRWSTAAFDNWDVNTADDPRAEIGAENLQHFRGLYGASVDYLDRVVTEFVADVQAATDRETSVVVTADHGENLAYPAENDLVGHDSSLSEGLLHVPLLVVNPPDGASGTVDGYVSHLDLGDLLVGLANGEVPDVTREQVPAELVGSSIAEPPENEAYWNRSLRAVYDKESKVVWDSLGESTRYELDHDRPCWQRAVETDVDYEAQESRFFDEPIADFRERAERHESATEVDEATAERLADLGYR